MELIKKYFRILQGAPDYLPSVISIVAANLIVLIGIWFFSWTISDMILLYWAESAIIGFFTIIKIALAGLPYSGIVGKGTPASINLIGPPQTVEIGPIAEKLFLIPFFIVHYGMFMGAHLVFLVVAILPGFGEIDDGKLAQILMNVAIGLVALVASHLISFVVNYIGRKEYARTKTGDLMTAPYGRIMAMQVFIIGSAFIFGMLDFVGSHIFVIIYSTIVIAGKTVFDVVGHLNERGAFEI